jgi:hypothetical protein
MGSDDMNRQNGNETLYKKLVKHIKTEIPGFEIKSKKQSRLMKFLSVALFFNKDFLSSYVTTLYPHVYIPKFPWKSNNPVSRIAILAHEYVHLKDRRRFGWWFNILYLSPQIFALLAIGAFWNLSWLWALLFLLPLPSPGRAWLEFRAYQVTAAVYWWLAREKINTMWLTLQFTSGSYYWMVPFKGCVEKRIIKMIENVESGRSLPPIVFEIKRVLGVKKW